MNRRSMSPLPWRKKKQHSTECLMDLLSLSPSARYSKIGRAGHAAKPPLAASLPVLMLQVVLGCLLEGRRSPDQEFAKSVARGRNHP